MDAVRLYEWVNTVGLPGGMALFIWALYTGKLVWGKDYDAIKKQLDALVEKALSKLDRIEAQMESKGGPK